MYEHPIKRAGLTFARILYSNSNAVKEGFPKVAYTKYTFGYTYKGYDKGREVARIEYSDEKLDEVLPGKKEIE